MRFQEHCCSLTALGFFGVVISTSGVPSMLADCCSTQKALTAKSRSFLDRQP
jgi:hypothetical protein